MLGIYQPKEWVNVSPREPGRSIRISDEIWEAAQDEAKERGEPLTAAIRKFLISYATRKATK